MNEVREIFEDKSNDVIDAVEIEDIQAKMDMEERLKFPMKTLISSAILFLVGSALLIAGLIEEFVDDDATKGMAMWIIGAITFIPGFYYTFLFIKAYRAKSANERMRILQEIPEF